jgi:hypothetical protein
MFPNRPVAIPDDPHNMQYPQNPYQIVSDPINAFSQGPRQFPQQLQQQFQQQYGPPQPPPSFGPNQQLAMQMAGYPGPSGIRSPMQRGVGAGFGGNAPGAYDGADATRGGSQQMWLANEGGKIGSGGGHPGTNQGWMDALLSNATGHGYGPAGGSFDIGGFMSSLLGSANLTAPSGGFTSQTGPTPVDTLFGLQPTNQPPSGPYTEAPGTGQTHSMRQPIPIIRRSRVGTSNR